MVATPGVEPGFALMAINKPPPAHPRRRRQRGDVKTVLSSQTARQMNLFNRYSAATAGIEPALLHWQADSLPLSHLGSPTCAFDSNKNKLTMR